MTTRWTLTWEQFARAAKLLMGFVWGTLELWQWGGRAEPLMFIGLIIAGTEGAQLWVRLRTLAADRPAGPE